MNELIAINYEKEKPTVSGRELHALLGINSEYAKWFERMCEYGFIEGKSYSSFLTNRSDGLPGKPKTDHAITIAMAKELCMLQRSAKGKECREYFISCEEAWNSPEKVMERAWQIFGLLKEKETLQLEVAKNEPKVIFADAVSVSDGTILIGELAKILKGNGIEIGQNRLFEKLREDGYLIKRKGTDYNAPTQRAMELKLFKVKETAVTHSDGHVTINKTTKVTGKGQQYFINLFLGGSQQLTKSTNPA